MTAAIREAAEEATVPPSVLRRHGRVGARPRLLVVTTVIAEATETFEPVIGDPRAPASPGSPSTRSPPRVHPGFAALLASSELACDSRSYRSKLTNRAEGSTPRHTCHGLWRSLVAHLTGGQGVAGSNPVSPTCICPLSILSSLKLLRTAALSPPATPSCFVTASLPRRPILSPSLSLCSLAPLPSPPLLPLIPPPLPLRQAYARRTSPPLPSPLPPPPSSSSPPPPPPSEGSP